MNAKSHLTTPDVLRGVAVGMVVVYHTFIRIYGTQLPWRHGWQDFAHPPSPHYEFLYPLSFGWAGVALFFVLSGFCIHLSFLKSTGFTWGRFFWQRFWRIYPAYFVALVFFCVLARIDLRSYAGIKEFGLHALLLHNFSTSSFFAINPSFWSLATEAQLYLLFPVLIILRQKWGIEGCLIVTFAVGLAWRGFALARWGLPDHLINPAFSFPFMTWFDWTLGAFVAERVTQQRRAFSNHSLWLMGLIPLFVMSTLYQPATAFSFTLAAAVSAVLLDLLLKMEWRPGPLLHGAVFIGAISYSLYLWHQPLLNFQLHGHFSDRLPSLHGPTRLIAELTVIFVLSVLSWTLIERSGIRLGKVVWASWTKSNGTTQRPRA